MRIRKNANISSLMFTQTSASEVLQTHVCLLNQSPWDVITFSQDASCQSSHFYQYQYEGEGEDSFHGNGSLGDSIGAVESSVASLMEEDPDEKTAAAAAMKIEIDNMIIDDDNNEIEGANQEKKRAMGENCEFKVKKGDTDYCCNKNDGKGWHCKNERKEGFNKSSTTDTCIPSSPKSMKKPDKGLASTRRARAKAAKKGQASSSNPYEFYYYSGFGPSWGKRRGDRNEGNKNHTREAAEINGDSQHNTTPFSTPSPIDHHQQLDFVDNEDDDDEDSESSENGDIGKKRMRKPVKARSLKSLM